MPRSQSDCMAFRVMRQASRLVVIIGGVSQATTGVSHDRVITSTVIRAVQFKHSNAAHPYVKIAHILQRRNQVSRERHTKNADKHNDNEIGSKRLTP